MLNMAMRKSHVATKTSRASTGSIKRTRVKEEEQLYLVRKSGNVAPRKDSGFRHPWPKPFDRTEHRLRLGDARDLSWIRNGTVHLIVTSPPYWTLKKYEKNERQLGEIEDYNAFLDELDKVWCECARVLAPGGRICCVVGV